MKKYLFNYLPFAILALLFSVENRAWGGTIDFSELGLENGVQYSDPFDGGDFTVTFVGGDNDGKYFNTGEAIRVFGNGKMVVEAKSGSLTQIFVTFANGDSYRPSSDNVVDTGTFDCLSGIWFGSAQKVTFTRPAGSGHWRVQAIEAKTDEKIISFKDSKVKAICVENWDTNNDGELSESEAAKVEYLESEFNGQSEITSFDEFQYFTGIEELNGCEFENCKNLQSITLPSSLKEISGSFEDGWIFDADLVLGIFMGCDNLSKIILPNSLTKIGPAAFAYCKGLRSIVIPNSVTSIGACAFYECSNLTSVSIPSTVTKIGKHCFDECYSLSEVNIPNGVQALEDYTFNDCRSLVSLIIPTTVSKIGIHCFYQCKNLSGVNIPNGVTYVGPNAFAYTNIQSLTLPQSLTEINSGSFMYCRNLRSVFIPKSISSIKYYYNFDGGDYDQYYSPFQGCCNLNSIIVENGNNKYDSRDNCNAIIEIANNNLIIGGPGTIIPSTVEKINLLAFFDCSELKSITIPNSVKSIGSYAFMGCTGLSTIEIPQSVEWLGRGVFSKCTGLTNVTVGKVAKASDDFPDLDGEEYSSIWDLSWGTFNNCTNITIVKETAEEPPVIDEETFPTRTKATLYVPAGSKDKYENAEYWWDFKEIQEVGQSSNIKGDVNGDGYVNMSDVTEIINIILGKTQ